ncbi:ComF family protein [Aliiroseovarius crassostreae]|uniref:ComF family protein n=1 Tax=Aliiroseovarius crassostreae TaxID=154981 RepID=UPI002205E08A|nr:ComF family protein [Aliiroseovarius crassostreae]UWQ04691.1 ComF family protein [Aliiroseovarius crassostreae]
MQSALRLLYPPQCVCCGEQVESEFGLCGACWRETPFIEGVVCDLCGAPLLGEEDNLASHCDDCLKTDRPWAHGRSALQYRDNARRMVLALKHGDRTDLARPAAGWMARAIAPVLLQNALIVPIPIHWTRLLKRRFNQAAELGRALSDRLDLEFAPDLLIRPRRTSVHDGLSAEERFENMKGAIKPHPKRLHALSGRHILLVDDVMTSGATFSAGADACLDAGAASVTVLSLARVAKEP